MYLIYVSNDVDRTGQLEAVLHRVDHKKRLLTLSNGYDLIEYLQNVKTGAAYPELIILSGEKSRLNGCELLELLKTDDIYRLIPVIVFLTEEESRHTDFCRQLGAETISTPQLPRDWVHAAKKICAACN